MQMRPMQRRKDERQMKLLFQIAATCLVMALLIEIFIIGRTVRSEATLGRADIIFLHANP